MLAKIAWGFAAAECLLDHVDQTQCVLSTMIDKPDEIGRWVGSANDKPTAGARRDVLHEVLAFERRGYLLYRVQLFASSGTPYYWVVAGKLKTAHPPIADPIAIKDPPEAAPIIDVLRALQPEASPATAPSHLTSVEVRRRGSESATR